MKMSTFGSWLRSQNHRNDPVGDLARDFRASGSRAKTAAGVRASIKRHIDLSDTDPVGRALNEAISEYGEI